MVKKPTVLVTATGGPAGLAAVRSLLKVDNIKIVSVDADSFAPGLYLTEVKSYTVPLATEENYLAKLLHVCKKENVKVVLPCSDEETLELSKRKQFFNSKRIQLPIADYNVIAKASDKWKMLNAISRSGIRAPKTFSPNTLNEFKNAIKQIGFPLVVRPRISRGARGVTYCENKGEAEFAFKQLRKNYGKIIIQEFIPGKNGSVFVVQTLWNHQHKLCACAVMQKLRERPPTGGVATAGKTVYNDHLRNLATSIVQRLGPWIGPAGVEFKVSKLNGQPYVMEVNPRLQGVTYLFTEAGINFPHLWVLIAFNQGFPPKFEYKELYFTRTWIDLTLGQHDLLQ
jgi:carbamoylphosphate synthase large subunit